MVHLTVVLVHLAHREQRVNMVRVALQKLSNEVRVMRLLENLKLFLQL